MCVWVYDPVSSQCRTNNNSAKRIFRAQFKPCRVMLSAQAVLGEATSVFAQLDRACYNSRVSAPVLFCNGHHTAVDAKESIYNSIRIAVYSVQYWL